MPAAVRVQRQPAAKAKNPSTATVRPPSSFTWAEAALTARVPSAEHIEPRVAAAPSLPKGDDYDAFLASMQGLI